MCRRVPFPNRLLEQGDIGGAFWIPKILGSPFPVTSAQKGVLRDESIRSRNRPNGFKVCLFIIKTSFRVQLETLEQILGQRPIPKKTEVAGIHPKDSHRQAKIRWGLYFLKQIPFGSWKPRRKKRLKVARDDYSGPMAFSLFHFFVGSRIERISGHIKGMSVLQGQKLGIYQSRTLLPIHGFEYLECPEIGVQAGIRWAQGSIGTNRFKIVDKIKARR